MTFDDFFEGALEVLVEVCVDDGVEQGVGVAEPVDHVLKPHGHLARRAEGHHQGFDEKRQPAQDERAHDDAQRLDSFALPRQRQFPLRLRVFLVSVLEQRRRARCVRQRQLVL